jgi:hypothetical protein
VGDAYKILPGSKKTLRRQNTQGFYGQYSGGGEMGKKSIRKGYRLEHELEEKLKELGFDAQRVPLSGQSGGLFSGDLIIDGKSSGGERKSGWI